VDHSSIIQTNNDDSNYGPQNFTKADTAKKLGILELIMQALLLAQSAIWPIGLIFKSMR